MICLFYSVNEIFTPIIFQRSQPRTLQLYLQTPSICQTHDQHQGICQVPLFGIIEVCQNQYFHFRLVIANLFSNIDTDFSCYAEINDDDFRHTTQWVRTFLQRKAPDDESGLIFTNLPLRCDIDFLWSLEYTQAPRSLSTTKSKQVLLASSLFCLIDTGRTRFFCFPTIPILQTRHCS